MMHSVYILLIICSIINLNVSSNSFISKRNLQESREIIVSHQNQDTSIHSFGESRESDENQFGLFKFASLLSNYTFSVKLEKDGTEDVSYIISSQCTIEDSKDNKLTLPHCSLVSWSGNKILNETVQQDLYLDKSKNYNVDVKNSTVKISEVVSNIVQKEQDNVVLEKTCHIDVSYYFINNKAQKPFNYVTDKIEELSIQLEVTGGDCNNNNITPLLNLEIKKTKETNIYGYVALMVFLGIAQSVTCGILVIKIDRNNIFAKQTSIGTLCMLISFDFCIFLQNFTYWTTLSSLMIFVFVLFFMVSIFFEPALLYFVFSTLQRSYNIPIRPLLFRLYLWLTVAAACILITQTYQSNYVYYMYPLCLLPKILDNMLYRQKNKWDLALLGGLVLPKLIYLNVTSLDIFGLSSTNYNPSTVIYAALVFIIEIMVLKVQSKWPGLGLVKKQTQKLFSYECQIDEIETVSSVICSICTEKIGLNPIIGQQPTQEQEPNTPATQTCVMKTPCLHYYHESCLKEWFKKKFECPNCRQRLPPLENDEDEE